MTEPGIDEHDPIKTLRVAVAAAMRERDDKTRGLALVGQACVNLLPVDGVAMSMSSGGRHREVLYASDEVVAEIESTQLTLGEGPGFTAFEARRPVLVTDLAQDPAAAWPMLAAELADRPVGALFAFPLQIGAITAGVLEMYRRQPGWFNREQLAIALQIVDVATVAMLGLRPESSNAVGGDQWLAHLPPDRYVVHQATGMLIAHHRIPAAQALSRLRGYAFSSGQLIEDVARAITARRLSPADIGD